METDPTDAEAGKRQQSSKGLAPGKGPVPGKGLVPGSEAHDPVIRIVR